MVVSDKSGCARVWAKLARWVTLAMALSCDGAMDPIPMDECHDVCTAPPVAEAQTTEPTPEVDRPNVLLIIADDLGLDAAAFDTTNPCYDVGDTSDDPAMPNIAALCESGVRFTNAWAMPQCSPSRASMLTGRYPFRTGVGAAISVLDDNGLATDELTLPRALDAADSGYTSAHIGKWHVSSDPTDPNTMGWHHFAGHLKGSLVDYFQWPRVEDGVTTSVDGYQTSVAVDDALDWLAGTDDAPWFLWLAFSAPHSPYHVPPAHLHDANLDPYVEGVDPRPYFAAMAQAMDTEIGRLLDGIEARGELEDTVIVFLGDNGTDMAVVGEPYHPQRAKGSVYQGGLQVPLVVSGPGVAGGRSEGALVSVVDVFPTVLELAGVDVAAVVAAETPDAPIDGASLVPYLGTAGAPPQHQRVYAQGFDFGSDASQMNHAVRDERFKLVCSPSEGAEMYDLSCDPYEQRNLLAHDPSSCVTEHFEELRRALEDKVGSTEICP